MKKFFLFILAFYLLQTNLQADSNILNFRMAYEHEKPDTFIAYDSNENKLYVENKPVIQVTDISKVVLIVDKKKPPLWMEQAAK